MSDYRFNTEKHNGIDCLHVLVDTLDADSVGMVSTHIPLNDIEAAIERYNVQPTALLQEINPESRENTSEAELIEQLADKEHASWSRWMNYLFSQCSSTIKGDAIIPVDLALRWVRQAETPYAQLSEQEKQSDRDEVAHILPIIRTFSGGNNQS